MILVVALEAWVPGARPGAAAGWPLLPASGAAGRGRAAACGRPSLGRWRGRCGRGRDGDRAALCGSRPGCGCPRLGPGWLVAAGSGGAGTHEGERPANEGRAGGMAGPDRSWRAWRARPMAIARSARSARWCSSAIWFRAISRSGYMMVSLAVGRGRLSGPSPGRFSRPGRRGAGIRRPLFRAAAAGGK
jgi:hypothetical protein